MPFWSAAPASSHSRTPYTRPSDRAPLPFMGFPEIDFRRAWAVAWTPVTLPVVDNPMAMIVALDAALYSVAHSLIEHAGPVIAAQLLLGAAAGNVSIPVVKARTRPTGMFSRILQAGPLPTSPSSPLPPPDRYLTAARKLTFNMVTDITQEQRGRLHQVIVQAFAANQAPRDIAHDVSSIIGLNDRWARAVYRLRSSMLANGISRSIAGQRAYAYAQELIAKRGIMVARTEMTRAFNAGRYESWLDRADNGTVNPDLVRKQWITAPGACLECVMTSDPDSTGLPKVVIGLLMPFQSPYGPILYAPLHPHCRCSVNYLPG